MEELVMNSHQIWKNLDPKYIKRSELANVQGVPFPTDTVEQWDAIWNFKARPDDLLICTYPKSGTTWMQGIVDMIQHGGDAQKCGQKAIYELMPFIELCLPKPLPSGYEDANAMPSPRTLKSHLPVQLLPPSFWELNCKIIYVARNPKDNVVSYYYFHKMDKMLPECGTWEEFLENFIAGKVAWGSWFDHVCGWWKAKDHHPVLYLFYEDMKKDPAREIQKVAKFLGKELSESVLNQIVQHTSFQSMKENPKFNFGDIPDTLMDRSVATFMRKGIVGDWKEHFTVAQSEQMDKTCAQLLAGSGLTFRTQL